MSTGRPDYPLRAPDAIARQPALPLGRGPSLELSDNEGIRRAALTLLPDGNPSLVMWDQEEKQSWKAP
jgi:hypothetical protein